MSATIRFLIAGCSDKHVRTQNQDRVFPDPQALPQLLAPPICVAVADGMGGTHDGAHAAQVATALLPQLTDPARLLQSFAASPTPIRTHAQPTIPELLELYFQHANERIIHDAGEVGRYGTTLSVLYLDVDQFFFGHIGDSRIYLLRQDELHQLTQDDNAFSDYIRRGFVAIRPAQLDLSAQDRSYLEGTQLLHQELLCLPPQDVPPLRDHRPETLAQALYGRFAEMHQSGQILHVGNTRSRLAYALGKERPLPQGRVLPPLPEALTAAFVPGDLFLLASDGLCGVVSDTALHQRLTQIQQRLDLQTPDESLLVWGSEMLFEDAVCAGSDDNISLLLVQVLHPPTPSYTSLPSASPTIATPHAPPHKASPHPTPQPPSGAPSAPANSTRTAHTPATHPAQTIPQAHTPPSPSHATPSPSHAAPSPQRGLPEHPHASQPAKTLTSRPVQDTLVTPTTHQGAPTKERLVWAFVVLCFACLGGWQWMHTPKDRPSTRKAPPQRRMQPTGPPHFGLFAMRLHAPHSALRTRLKALSRLNRSASMALELWQLSAKAKHRLLMTLSDETLSPTHLLEMTRKVPLEASNFVPFDKALQQAALVFLQVLSPTSQRYLDEMHTPPKMPPAKATHQLTPKQLRQLRLHYVVGWLRYARKQGWQSWQLQLHKEQLVSHPYRLLKEPETLAPPEKETAQTRLRLCLKSLKRAHKAMLQQSSAHPLLQELHNRIQLHQAWLTRLAADPKHPKRKRR